MSADDEDLVGLRGPDELADDVERRLVRQRAAVQRELELDRVAGREQRRQPLGRARADRGRRDLRHAVRVAHRAGVRMVVEAQRQRAHEHRDRADARRLARTGPALTDRLAVRAERVELGRIERLIEERDRALRARAVLAQVAEPLELDDAADEARRRRRDAAAEREHGELLARERARRGDRQLLARAAFPMRDHARLQAHVREAEREHLLAAPLDGGRVAGRAGHALRRRCAQIGEDRVAAVVLERAREQRPAARTEVRRRRGGRLCERGNRRQDDREQRGEAGSAHARDSTIARLVSEQATRKPLALVTGGNSGIGEAIARRIARGAGRVFVAGRNLARAEAVARSIEADGGRAWPLELDIASAASRAAALARVRELAGGQPVTWLVNAAGIAKSAPLPRHPTDAAAHAPDAAAHDLYAEHLAVNFHGARHMLEALLPAMREHRYGRVVNIASSAALRGYAYVSAYCASKHALLGYSRAAALELAGSGVAVHTVCPHYVDTPLLAQSIALVMEKTGKTLQEARAFFAAQNPGGRLIEVDEVAEAAWHLVIGDREGVVVELDGSGTTKEHA
ncbi:MAG: SDR family NAD(P)-dependent oxidoreductase [Planctomycetota bacterium]|nr:MAG: SDR family NAD(P)-dependent oxidoreductase [Planctomycetota bacterium]